MDALYQGPRVSKEMLLRMADELEDGATVSFRVRGPMDEMLGIVEGADYHFRIGGLGPDRKMKGLRKITTVTDEVLLAPAVKVGTDALIQPAGKHV